MDLYNVLLFAHILGAVLLIGASLLSPLLMRMLAGTATVDSLREWARFNHAVGRTGNPAAVVVLIAGVWMTFLQWSWGDAWILASLAVFAVMGALAGMVLDPHAKRLLAAAVAAPAGPVTDELREIVHDPTLHRVHRLFLPLDMAVLYMMTSKPGWIGAGASIGLALAAAVVLILRGARRPAAAMSV